MIQRIQTLYLLLAVALMATATFIPVAQFTGGGVEFSLKAFSFAFASSDAVTISMSDVGDVAVSALCMGIVYAVAALLPLLIIFLFKNRQLQIRLCGVELTLLLGCIVFEVISCCLAAQLVDGHEGATLGLEIGAFLPLVAIVPVALAMRAILRDELLVRSLDRIR